MADDFYEVLGIARTASAAEIQKAYRELARKYHPDMNPDDKSAQEKFKKVQRAYEVLSDPKQRKLFDQFGSQFEAAAGQQPGRGPGGGGGFPGGFATEDVDLNDIFGGAGGFGDLFRQFTGGAGGRETRRHRGVSRRGRDLTHTLEVPFSTAVLGGEAQISLRRANGKTDNISVKIPAGIENGKKIRLRGQGEKGTGGGRPGDILIQVNVAAHSCFRRTGNHLEVDVPVTVKEAALGAKIDVPTPKGTITMTLPPATSSGKRLRAKGQGIATAGGSAGDLTAVIQIVLPEAISKADQEQIQSLKIGPKSPRAELRW